MVCSEVLSEVTMHGSCRRVHNESRTGMLVYVHFNELHVELYSLVIGHSYEVPSHGVFHWFVCCL